MITKMEKANVVFIRFRSSDVITASGDDPVPVVYTQIWLTSSSVNNYNAIATQNQETSLLKTGTFDYYAYNGDILDMPDYGIYGWNTSGKSNTSPGDEYLFNVGKNDAAGYQRVLDWLLTASGKASN